MHSHKEEDIVPKRKVEKIFFRDELTNAFNRRYLFQYLPQEISTCKGTGKNIWLFMIDIDDFKTFNDNYGHLAGDEILKGVVEILNQHVRPQDTVIRYAGDEFTIILPDSDLSDVISIAKKINKAVSESKFKSETGRIISRVNLSIGIANFPDDATDALKLIDLADRALYVSKQKGKNRISLVSDISVDFLREKEISERFPCPKLIEREKQMQRLKDILATTKEEKKFTFVVITGEAGIGKTRLLDEFTKFLSSQNYIYFYSVCSEQHITQAYFYFISNLEKLLKNIKDIPLNKNDIVKGLSKEQQSLLTGFLPSLREIFQVDYSMEQNVSKQETEKKIQDALVKLLINISSNNPLCILCDDFHKIDRHSLELILSLKEQNSQIMFCGAFAEEDISSSEVLEYPLVNELNLVKSLLTEQIELPSLSKEATSQLIHAILVDMEPSEEFDGLIYKISKGNPLFIEELLKFLIQKGFIYLQKGKWGKIEINESDIPHSLEEVIQERIRALDSTAQELIAKAAVIGQDFNIELLYRMGKENEGYILDILESAKKVGIIKQKISPYGEEMSFVSDEIRKVLYELIEQDKLKSFHKQLGEIQEGLYSGNLDQIVGELYYHFKKAEDYHRATQYAKRIEESNRMLFGRAIEYAKEILEDIEEQKAGPLNRRSLELIPDLIKLLYSININFALYPKGSQMLQNPIDQIYYKLTEIFARDEILIFSEVKDALVVNGRPYTNPALKKGFKDSFISLLKSHNIESLTFKKGLSKKELVAFIESINTISDAVSLSEMLKSKEVTNIIINEISYEIAQRSKISKKREKLEDVMLVDYLLGKVSSTDGENFLERLEQRPWEIAEAISEMGDMVVKEDKQKNNKDEVKADVVVKSVQMIANQIMKKVPGEWDKHKKNLAKTILSLEPKLRRKVLLKDGTTEVGKQKDILKELIPEFPDDVVIELLTQEFIELKASPSKMRGLIKRFLVTPSQQKRLLPILKEKFTRAGLSKEDIPWVFAEKEWRDLSLDEKVRVFSKMTAKDFLDLEIDINSLILETFRQNREDLLKKILDKWGEFLKDKTPDIKSKINIIFRGLIDLIPSSKDELVVNLIDFLFEEFREEKDLDIYSQLIAHLTRLIIAQIEKKNLFAANKMVSKLNKEISKDLSAKQKKCIQEAIDKITEPARLKSIVNELIKKIDANAYYEDIQDFIIEINNPTIIKLLIEEAMIDDKALRSLGYFAAFLRRRTIGLMLGKMIKGRARQIINEELLNKLSSKSPYIIRNAIELFVFINDQLLVKSLGHLLQHDDINIRSKVIFALGRIGGKESIQLLTKVLADKEKTTCLKAIEVLGKIGDKATVEMLKRYSSDRIIGSKVLEAIKKIESRNNKKRES
jgi:diguanylate cyclase (GGDEF)-like protein